MKALLHNLISKVCNLKQRLGWEINVLVRIFRRNGDAWGLKDSTFLKNQYIVTFPKNWCIFDWDKRKYMRSHYNCYSSSSKENYGEEKKSGHFRLLSSITDCSKRSTTQLNPIMAAHISPHFWSTSSRLIINVNHYFQKVAGALFLKNIAFLVIYLVTYLVLGS